MDHKELLKKLLAQAGFEKLVQDSPDEMLALGKSLTELYDKAPRDKFDYIVGSAQDGLGIPLPLAYQIVEWTKLRMVQDGQSRVHSIKRSQHS